MPPPVQCTACHSYCVRPSKQHKKQALDLQRTKWQSPKEMQKYNNGETPASTNCSLADIWHSYSTMVWCHPCSNHLAVGWHMQTQSVSQSGSRAAAAGAAQTGPLATLKGLSSPTHCLTTAAVTRWPCFAAQMVAQRFCHHRCCRTFVSTSCSHRRSASLSMRVRQGGYTIALLVNCSIVEFRMSSALGELLLAHLCQICVVGSGSGLFGGW
jgi:hypothetical protein